MRHTGLTWMADAGVPVHTLRKIVGHGTLTTTQRYLHPDRHSVTDAGDMLSRHLWSPMVANYVSFRLDKHRIVTGQSLFRVVGLTEFEPATT